MTMPHKRETRAFGAAVMIGIGIMAAVDEIIFHQVLGWHHFYDLSTPTVGLLSDGILHACELLALVAGFFWLLEARSHGAWRNSRTAAGFFLGAGGFQLFDGLINHKVLRLHQIRYGVNVVPYDIAWNAAALTLLCIGLWLLRRSQRRPL